MRQVELQRRDRDMAIRHRVKVGALAGIERVAGRPDPPDRITARIDLPYYRLRWMALAEPRNTPLAHLVIRQTRNVHIEQRMARHGVRAIERDDVRPHAGCV